MTEIGERNDGPSADAQHIVEHDARTLRRLQCLRQNHIIETVFGIIAEIGVGVALNHGEAFRDAIIDAALRQFDAAPVDLFLPFKHLQQETIAAAHVQHAAARFDNIGHYGEVETPGRDFQTRRHGRVAEAGAIPRARAADSRKPRVVAKKSGS